MSFATEPETGRTEMLVSDDSASRLLLDILALLRTLRTMKEAAHARRTEDGSSSL